MKQSQLQAPFAAYGDNEKTRPVPQRRDAFNKNQQLSHFTPSYATPQITVKSNKPFRPEKIKSFLNDSTMNSNYLSQGFASNTADNTKRNLSPLMKKNQK
jgi:hypothetical protein